MGRKLFPMKKLPLVALALVLNSCAPPRDEASAGHQTFPVRGIVQQRMGDDPATMIIDHEEIPGFMPRMIMPFRALDPKEFEALEPGMVVTFDYHVGEHESWVTGVKTTGEKGAITYEEDKPAHDDLVSPGDAFPDYAFRDETGKAVHLSDYRGIPVAITFVFSRCPVPEYCPRMMSHFATVLEKLKPAPDAPSTFRLLTISFDHEFDTPEILRSWGAAFGHRRGLPWSLLSTPDKTVIDEISSRTGLRFGTVNGTIQHNLRTLVINPDGTLRRLFTDENWTVDELITELGAAASQGRN
jgi:protein SCO1